MDWPGADGEMAARFRLHDWAGTALGPIDTWPPRLRTIVDLMLGSDVIMAAPWGDQSILLYNDAYSRLIGERSRIAFGRPVFEALPELRPVLGPQLAEALAGRTVRVIDQFYPFVRTTFLEDAWFDVCHNPVRDEGGSIVGVLTFLTETTERVIAARRREADEVALRESDERQAFLLTLSDALRQLDEPSDMLSESCRLLRHQIGAMRVAWGEMLPDGVTCVATGEDMAEGVYSLAGRDWDWNAFDPAGLAALKRGETIHREDVESAHDLAPELKATFVATGFRAYINVPLVEQGRLVSFLLAHWQGPRPFAPTEIAWMEETAERTAASVQRAQARAVLRASEERQAFLLQLSDELRPLSDPAEIQHAAMRLLAEKHDVMRAGYMDVHADGDTLTMAAKFEREVVPLPPQIRLSDYGSDIADAFRAGHTMCVRDAVAEAETEAQRAAHRAIGVLSWIIAPLVKGGRLIAIVGVVAKTPRDWTPTEIQLVTDLAERTWDGVQRARAEAALRASEERFAQFAASSADALWIRDAGTLDMEYVSPAIATIYGVEPDTFLNGVQVWASAIIPEDRAIALEHLERARQGESVVHEFRIQRPSDHAFRWIRNTDFPLYDAHGRVQRIGGIAQDVTEARLSAEHQGVLLAELQHRVRNIMALIRSITARTGESSESVAEYAAVIDGRLLTFARVQALLTRGVNVGVAIGEIVRDELAAQAGHEDQYSLDGPEVILSPKAAEVLTLAVHELTTNALKYGGLSVPEGRVTVRWATFERRGTSWLGLDWTEEGAPERPQPPLDVPRRRGFGSELIEGRIPYELKGRGKVAIEPGGARCHLEFPLQEGASILETDAPQRAAVFGGALDMTGEADLSGHRILVVEDDYYIATDAARAFRGAGAEVLGPFSTEEDARAQLEQQRPDAALIDINLGLGPSFTLAKTLKDDGIPFVFSTGYDLETIPAEFAGVERMQKPVQLRHLVAVVGRLLTPRA